MNKITQYCGSIYLIIENDDNLKIENQKHFINGIRLEVFFKTVEKNLVCVYFNIESKYFINLIKMDEELKIQKIDVNEYQITNLAEATTKIRVDIFGPSKIINLESKILTVIDHKNVWDFIEPHSGIQFSATFQISETYPLLQYPVYLTKVENELKYFIKNRNPFVRINGKYGDIVDSVVTNDENKKQIQLTFIFDPKIIEAEIPYEDCTPEDVKGCIFLMISFFVVFILLVLLYFAVQEIKRQNNDTKMG